MKFDSYSMAGPDPNPMTVEEVDCIKNLINEYVCLFPITINIGAERGVSTLAILEEGVRVVFSVDTDPCEGEYNNAGKAGLDVTRIIRILGKSQMALRNFPYKVDFIWVDGDHSYEAVLEDIEICKRIVSYGGVIAFHDCFDDEPPAHNPSGAGQAVREEMMNDPLFEMVANVDRIRAFKRIQGDKK